MPAPLPKLGRRHGPDDDLVSDLGCEIAKDLVPQIGQLFALVGDDLPPIRVLLMGIGQEVTLVRLERPSLCSSGRGRRTSTLELVGPGSVVDGPSFGVLDERAEHVLGRGRRA